MKRVLDEILQRALEEAVASLATKAKDMVEEALGEALRAKVEALLEGEETPTFAPTRARAKAEATQSVKVRRRKKEDTPKLEEDLATILEGVKLALGKYSGVSTPRGKPLPEVLYRRVKKTLGHAQGLGRTDLASLARSALAYIHGDPKGIAMGSWQALAAKLGLPIPVAQAE